MMATFRLVLACTISSVETAVVESDATKAASTTLTSGEFVNPKEINRMDIQVFV